MKAKNIERINDWFEVFAKKLIKIRWLIIITILIIVIISSMGLSKVKLDNSMEGWFLEGAEIKKAQDEFKKLFGNNDYVALLIEADDVFSPEILHLLRYLGDDLERNVDFADKVTSLSDMEFSYTVGDDIIIENLVPDVIPTKKEEIEKLRERAFSKKFLINRIFSKDSTKTWLMLRLYPFPDNWEEEGKKINKSFLEFSKKYKEKFINDFAKSEQNAYNEFITSIEEWATENNIYFNENDFSKYQEELVKDYKFPVNIFISKDKFLKNSKRLYSILIHSAKNQVIEQTDSPSNRVGREVLSILNEEKYKKYNIKPTGMPVMAYEEMTFAENEMSKLTGLALILSIIILIIFLRSVRGVVIPVITTVSAIIIIFGIMGHLGIKINATTMSIPVFIGFAVSIGYSIHIFNFYKRKLLFTGERKESVYHSVKQSGWAIFFTALTTIASLLSFYFVSLAPIQWLGLTSAAVIFCVYIIIMTLTPVLLSFGKDFQPKKHHMEKKALYSDKLYVNLGKWVFKFSIPIIIIFILIMAVLIYGLTKIEINVDTKRTYGKKVPYVNRMIEIANTEIGSFMSYDITFNFHEENKIKDPEILKKFDEFISEVKEFKNTKRVSSILDIIKDMNQLLNGNNPEFYKIPDDKNMIAQLLLLYEMSGGTEASQWIDNDYSILRLMVEIKDMDANNIRETISILKNIAKEYFPNAKFSITGSMSQVAALNYYVSIGQIKSFTIALIVIMILLIIVFRSFKMGVIGMIPNISPAIAIGGLMGLLNIPLDFMTITLMPMILGLAVDDTIHFISHSNMEFQLKSNYKLSILETFRLVGKALFMTSFILVASFALYFTSRINMFFNMGLFIVVGISVALLSDFFITPILINWAKPFGKEKNLSI